MSEDPPDKQVHETWDYPGGITVEFYGETDERYHQAIDESVAQLVRVFDGHWPPALQDMKIIIANGLIKGGGEAFPKEKKIILDKDKNMMSLTDAEEHVLNHTEFEIEKGDMTNLTPDPDRPYSSAIVNIVHEAAHILDWNAPGNGYNRLDPSHSPSRYGSREPHEAFAIAFTDYVFGKDITPEAKRAVEATIGKNWGNI